jgi:hypothetical protein
MPYDSTLGASRAGSPLTPPDERPFAPSPTVAPALPCSDCRDLLRLQYFALNGRPVCTRCKATYQAKLDRGTGPAAMRRAALYGSGAALGGAACLAAVVLVIGFGRIPMSIGIAWMVATAIGKATDGYGGRRYQILAVALTYFAIGLGSVAPMVGELRRVSDGNAAPVVAQRGATTDAQAAFHEVTVGPTRSAESRRASRLAGNGPSLVLGIFLLVLAAPLMSLFTFGIYGLVISVLAFGYGMRRAWEMTAESSPDWEIRGPFRVGQGPIAAMNGSR